MADVRPSTPPPPAKPQRSIIPSSPITPEHVRQLEIKRLKAKALREEREAAPSHAPPPALQRSSSSNIAAGQKRPISAISTSNTPRSSRDARIAEGSTTGAGSNGDSRPSTFRPLEEIEPARNFKNFVEYDFSKMTDTKGGFMTEMDDPHNKALYSVDKEEKPSHMTMKEWERHQLLKRLRDQKIGPFEPGLGVLGEKEKKRELCRECGSLEIDFRWLEILRCAVCNRCKEELPEKYSLLTKTEAKEDYLLTDPELRDEELLPHLERPNPHKSTWNNMMLFLRYQVEEYAFSSKKWGSGDALDREFEKREQDKRKRKEGKFRQGLEELKKKTRVEAWRRAKAREGGEAVFGEEVRRKGAKHEHVWGRTVDDAAGGGGVKRCVECGMEVEELEF